ncbi:hypothetical protein DFH06DRAFT_1130980 [Mycena polygramma]|nr:hypothetical protein DFH06DRAFT_1130980 [Mycena polygramma]
MPARHVRFSTENRIHCPPASDSSSSGTWTMPTRPRSYLPGPTAPSWLDPRLPGPTPYAFPYFANVRANSKGRAHSLIVVAGSTTLHYDFSLPSSAIPTNFAGFHEPAVFPSKLALSILIPYHPWTLPVGPSNGRYVTVSDVINAVHRSLHTGLTQADFDELGKTILTFRVAEAYTRRCRRMRVNRHRGADGECVKRVDLLLGCTRFRGLSATSSPDVWRLHLG